MIKLCDAWKMVLFWAFLEFLKGLYNANVAQVRIKDHLGEEFRVSLADFVVHETLQSNV